MEEQFNDQLSILSSHILAHKDTGIYIDPILDPHLPLILSSFLPLYSQPSASHKLIHNPPRTTINASDYPLLAASRLHSTYCIPSNELFDWISNFDRNISLFSLGASINYTPLIIEGRANVAVVIMNRMGDLVAPVVGIDCSK
jgi:hypothetical protein